MTSMVGFRCSELHYFRKEIETNIVSNTETSEHRKIKIKNAKSTKSNQTIRLTMGGE